MRGLVAVAASAVSGLAREVDVPWDYRGYDSFPANYFGANPTGMIPGDTNATLKVMAKHQLVGWGWQQGMYDFPCKADTEELCLSYAAQNFSTYAEKQGAGRIPSFVYRNAGAGLLNFGHDVGMALNCSLNFTGWPTVTQSCLLRDPALEKYRREWFVHDKSGRICGGSGGVPAFQATWQKSAPGVAEWWDRHIGGWLAANLTPASAVFLDVIDGLGCAWDVTTRGDKLGNCSLDSLSPGQVSAAARQADSEATVSIVARLAERLRPQRKAVIVNSGRRLGGVDGERCLSPWDEFYGNLSAVPNLLWFFEAWNASQDLETAVRFMHDGVPKVVHYFGNNDTLILNAMASFLIAQGDYDYFGASSEWTDGGWSWHDMYDTVACGRPKSPPVRSGAVWTRDFEHCAVRYDLGCDTPTRDGCGSIRPAR
eukprot:TRINITY_DN40216_c0_g1_i1.p1 TRINITY_DN40216_c0_g1~~TRINITY_DN40216_c0_g1_i1.p1  ORF type:complete len:449 (+),score=108.82 TRINITY_DN40216_c0_g1_i1:72-1349(+)